MPEKTRIAFVGEEHLLGLNGLFNTFRGGTKWNEAGLLGQRVELVVVPPDPNRAGTIDDGVTVGEAEVVRVEVGRFDDMAAAHAGMNHAFGRAESQKVRRSALLAFMRECYGSDFNGQSIVTVLYLNRGGGE